MIRFGGAAGKEKEKLIPVPPAHFALKNKMRRFQDEISGIDADQLLGPVQQEIARRRTYHSRFENAVIQIF